MFKASLSKWWSNTGSSPASIRKLGNHPIGLRKSLPTNDFLGSAIFQIQLCIWPKKSLFNTQTSRCKTWLCFIFYIYSCICNAHTFLMTARNKTAIFQNLGTVSDVANSVTWRLQRDSGLQHCRFTFDYKRWVHKDSTFRCSGEFPKKEVVMELK